MHIEIATFRLAPGVSDEEFLAADQAVQEEFFYRREGLVRRTAARAGSEWVVVTLWGSAAHADAAAAAMPADPAGSAFSALINPAGLDRRRYETLD